MDQLVQLNTYMDEFNERDVNVYGISPASPEEHRQLKEELGLSFSILSDRTGELGISLGFIDEEEQAIYRGYTAINPETEQMVREIDYLVGENAEDILEVIDGM
ncbi:redoxin domain-containing protein [Evansella sp. LMS18]|uniref:redoxin domain-containing protein n=1 Tax=Evansella sp. LMS18 TaxID=2924033 RepID=UPI0020CFFBC0|nr:redoxin domain-containing protein [Evansella sp. LMS18]